MLRSKHLHRRQVTGPASLPPSICTGSSGMWRKCRRQRWSLEDRRSRSLDTGPVEQYRSGPSSIAVQCATSSQLRPLQLGCSPWGPLGHRVPSAASRRVDRRKPTFRTAGSRLPGPRLNSLPPSFRHDVKRQPPSTHEPDTVDNIPVLHHYWETRSHDYLGVRAEMRAAENKFRVYAAGLEKRYVPSATIPPSPGAIGRRAGSTTGACSSVATAMLEEYRDREWSGTRATEVRRGRRLGS